MIPKKIHYIWVGGNPLTPLAEKCIESWKKFCPDYEIKRWDESNLDINCCDYVREAYENKKYAFASDVLRLQKLYEYGGIYLDIDVELLKPIDNLLKHDCFSGFEASRLINPGVIFGSKKGNKDIKNILDIYLNRRFVINDKLDLKTICETVTEYYQEFGLKKEDRCQKLDKIMVYSSDYFSPINMITNKKRITKNTYSIHWLNASWYSKKQKLKNKVKKILNFFTFGLFGKLLFKGKKL